MAKITKWISKHKTWMFSGIGVAILILITACDNKGAKVVTGPITVQGGGNFEIIGGDKTSLDGKDVATIVEKIVAQNTRDKEGLFQEIGNLKEQLALALQRAAEADIPEAKGVIEELRKTGDTKRLLDVLVKERDLQRNSLIERNREIAAVAYLRGDIEIARTAVEEILKLHPNDVDALNRKGCIEFLQGNLDESEKLFSQILEIGLADNNDFWQAAGSCNLGLIYKTRGELDKAEEMLKKTLEIDKRIGRIEGMANDYSNLGLIYRTRGELDKAEEMFKKSLEISEKLGQLEGMANQYCNLGIIYGKKEELDKAEEMFNKVLKIEEKLGRPESIANAYGNLGLIYRMRGELGKAEEMHKKSLGIAERIGWLEGMARQYGNLGIIYGTMGELDKAEEMLKKSLEIDEKIGQLEGMAIDCGNLGGVYEQRGDLKGAREYWEKARDLYRKIGMANEVKEVEGWIKELGI